MAKAIRYCKLEEEHIGDNCFDISRPNVFGNPYTHIKNKKTKALVTVKTREEAIRLYDIYFDKMVLTNDRFKEAWDKMYDAYVNNEEIYIGCYCHLTESCHGDIIIKKLRQRAIKEELDKMKSNTPTSDS